MYGKGWVLGLIMALGHYITACDHSSSPHWRACSLPEEFIDLSMNSWLVWLDTNKTGVRAVR